MSMIKIIVTPFMSILHIFKCIKKLTLIHISIIISALILLSFSIGFLYFVSNVNSQAQNIEPLTKSDAITILTGGSNRLQSAISLLEKGYSQHLLISGVNPKTTAEDLKRLNPEYIKLFTCCIELGHSANNTKENALEIANWVNKNNYNTLIVVTSNYHMPRALLEIKAVAPNIKIIQYPIISDKIKTNKWFSEFKSFKILIDEYIKILLIYIFR